MSTENPTRVRALLVEDNPGDAGLIRHALAEVPRADFDLACVDNLSTALSRLAEGGIDVILLDLGLPDSQGLDTFTTLHVRAPDVPTIVLSGLADEVVAVKAMQAGAQDYLVKGEVDGRLLARSIRYAVERHQLQLQLQLQLQSQLAQAERERRSLGRMSGEGAGNVTARLYGRAPLREAGPEAFAELVQGYEDLLGLALEERGYKVEHNIPERLRPMAEEMGLLGAGPRDVVEVHATALKEKCRDAPAAKAAACAEEGRLMVLQVMGYLVEFYRRYAVRPQREPVLEGADAGAGRSGNLEGKG